MYARHLLVAALLVSPLVLAQVAPLRQPTTSSAPAGAYREATWEELVPKDWDPFARFKSMDLARLSDSSPKMQEVMRDLREVLDNAPTNASMNGAAIKLAGYVVPLEEVKGELKEFLLVPYFGACIHTPPPPANQIVHVVVAKPTKNIRSMDAVWVSGTLKSVRTDSAMGASGYRMDAVLVDQYVAPNRR